MVKIKSMIRKSVNCLVTLSLMFFVFLSASPANFQLRKVTVFTEIFAAL